MTVKIVTKNKKAFFNYHIEERFEAGMVLQGSEVKALREGKANLVDAYAQIKNGEIYLHKANISQYSPAANNNHLPTRTRKLLLQAREIGELAHKLQAQGYTLIPLALYFKNGYAKCELGLCKGKKQHDKRKNMKKRQSDREISRALKR